MEIVFTNKKNDLLVDNKITGVYGDLMDLIKLGVDVDGIIYDDSWTVRRFLNGHHLRLNSRIVGVFNYLDLSIDLLSKKLDSLSKTDFKFVLLAKTLLNNNDILIFDYFDVGLTYKDQKRIIKIIRNLKHDGKTIAIVSRNLVFMNNVCDIIEVVNDGELLYNGKMSDLLTSDMIEENEILKFIRLANNKNAKLDYTLDSKELLKDIYRSVY